MRLPQPGSACFFTAAVTIAAATRPERRHGATPWPSTPLPARNKFGSHVEVSNRSARAVQALRLYARPMDDSTWRVLPHRPLEALEENLWRVEGDLEGMPLKRVMTVAKRSDGRLVIHNAIALEEEGMKRIEELGEPAYLVVPNGYHRMDAPRFKARYPKLKVVCPKNARAKVAKVVEVDLGYAGYPDDKHVSLTTLAGVGEAEGFMTVRSQSGTTVVFNDAVFNMPHLTGAQGWVLKHVTGSTGGPRISRITRLFLVKDKRAFRADLERIAETERLKRVIVSHHEVIDGDAAGTLRAVAATI